MAKYHGIEGFSKDWADGILQMEREVKALVSKTKVYRISPAFEDEDYDFEPYLAKATKYDGVGLHLVKVGGEKDGMQVIMILDDNWRTQIEEVQQ